MRGVLCLEDGFYVEGEFVGAPEKKAGEAVFFTGMTGYEDSVTDPSYCGQILVFSFPTVGNYGIPPGSGQSAQVWVQGVVVRDTWTGPVREGWKPFHTYLRENKCPLLSGVDTRKLVLHLRENGTKNGVIAPVQGDLTAVMLKELQDKAASFEMIKHTAEARAKRIQLLNEKNGNNKVAVVIDFGIKNMIKEFLLDMGCKTYLVPPATGAAEILNLKPDFILLSNGPGSPEDNSEAIGTARQLLGIVPLYGIGLGHQILAKAAGAQIIKLTCGHHGFNHPVKNLETGKIRITSQNHTYAVDEESLPENIRITHKNINDGTVEGIRFTHMPAASVQFHSEDSPGSANGWLQNIMNSY